MGNAMAGRPGPKERLPDKAVRFFDEHPIYVKAYVPVIVTATLIVQIYTGCS